MSQAHSLWIATGKNPVMSEEQTWMNEWIEFRATTLSGIEDHRPVHLIEKDLDSRDQMQIIIEYKYTLSSRKVFYFCFYTLVMPLISNVCVSETMWSKYGCISGWREKQE